MDQLNTSNHGESIKVFVRVRPPDPNLDSDIQRAACLDVTSDTTLTVYSKPDPKVFTFDHVADQAITQEDVFSSVGRPTIDSCMHGYNGTIFAYGQTGSGKTFTMIGPPSEDSAETFTHELRGIIPRSFEYLFSLINRSKQKYGDLVDFLCKCSFLEIYNEQVFDLLDPASCGLHLRENMKRGVYVDGLTETSVTSAKEAYQVLSTGWVNRRVASTSMNRESSRSHAVFTLSIESKKRETKDAVAKIRTSLLNLVDLAGSERQRDTHAAGLRLKEAGSINRSLSALGNVIMALVDIANGKSRHVHYRDSKLTFLLRDSLGGNAKTNLVANVHPSSRCFGESLSTLNFARRAKMIRNKAVVNEDTSGNVLQLQAEIKRLRHLIQRYKNDTVATPISTAPVFPSSPSPPLSSGGRSDDDKTLQELKNMLAASTDARDRADNDKNELMSRVENLQQLCDKKDKFNMSMKMIVKFREAHISNLEKELRSSSTDPPPSHMNTIDLLKQEIEQLKYLVDHHPDGNRLALENLDLKAELKKVRVRAGREDVSRQLEHSHRYTLQLEKQLRYYLTRGNINGSSPLSQCLTPTKSTKLTFDLESLQLRVKQLQEELDKTRRAWNSDREEYQLRESKMEASLTAARKANAELERSLEAQKLKNSVEKATLNDIHMTTIKTILTPRKDREQHSLIRNRSYSCTPNVRRADTEPVRHQLTFSKASSADSASPTSSTFPTIIEASLERSSSPGPVKSGRDTELAPPPITPATSIVTPYAKKPRLSKSPAVFTLGSDDEKIESIALNGEPQVLDDSLNEGEEPEAELDELNIQGALTDELKILQDRNRSLQQQLEDMERRVVHLTQAKGTLEAQLRELTQLSRLEREGFHDKEQGYLEKIAEMGAVIADLKSTNEVAEGEVQDLRLCLKSADKELKEVKEERREETRAREVKIMGHLQKIGELEQKCLSEESKFNRAMEDLQNIQDEAETLREELTFKDHRLLELEEALKKEKEQVNVHVEEVQSVLDKLTLEVEKNTRLSLELQEGRNGSEELVSMMNDNAKLTKDLEELQLDLQHQLQSHKQQMTETEATINTLFKQKKTDEVAIAGFVASIQELRGEKVQREAKVQSLTQDLEDSGKELAAAVAKSDTMIAELAALREQLAEQTRLHVRELAKKEAEKEIILDDHEALSDQYQCLTMTFESQSVRLTEAEADLLRVKEELERSEGELNRLLLQDKMARRQSVTKMHSGEEEWNGSLVEANTDEEKEQLKRRLEQAAEMIESYEKSMEEKNKELQSMKDTLTSMSQLHEDYDQQQAAMRELKYELSRGKEHFSKLDAQQLALKADVERLQQDKAVLAGQREEAVAESSELREGVRVREEQLTAIREQVERYKNSEETLFLEKENIRSQLEMIQEEKAKLSKECEKLAKENAAITGHQNVRQRIQYHATVKVENAKLKEEVIQLRSRLRRKADQVDKLQTILTEKGLELSRPLTTNSKKRTHLLGQPQEEEACKENINP